MKSFIALLFGVAVSPFFAQAKSSSYFEILEHKFDEANLSLTLNEMESLCRTSPTKVMLCYDVTSDETRLDSKEFWVHDVVIDNGPMFPEERYKIFNFANQYTSRPEDLNYIGNNPDVNGTVTLTYESYGDPDIEIYKAHSDGYIYYKHVSPVPVGSDIVKFGYCVRP